MNEQQIAEFARQSWLATFGGTYSIVTHNAIGTVHSLIRGFKTLDEAKAYRVRFAYTGVFDCPIIKAEDEQEIWRLNNRYGEESRRLYLAGF